MVSERSPEGAGRIVGGGVIRGSGGLIGGRVISGGVVGHRGCAVLVCWVAATVAVLVLKIKIKMINRLNSET